MCHRRDKLFASATFDDSLILLQIVLILAFFVNIGLLCFITGLDEMIFVISKNISIFCSALLNFPCCIISCKMVRQRIFLVVLGYTLLFVRKSVAHEVIEVEKRLHKLFSILLFFERFSFIFLVLRVFSFGMG